MEVKTVLKKILSTVVLIAIITAVFSVAIVPCSAAVVTDGENFYTLGDANNDGVMDVRDLVRIKRYIADNSVEIIIIAADIDADGELNAIDLTICRKGLLEADETFTTGGNYWSGIY